MSTTNGERPRKTTARTSVTRRGRVSTRPRTGEGPGLPTRLAVEHIGVVGSPAGRAVIVGDILDTGGTLVSCWRELRRAGAEEIGVIATQGLFTGQQWRALFIEGVQRMWITDTVLARRRPPWAEVVSVSPLLAPVLDRSHPRLREDGRAPGDDPYLPRPAHRRP